MSRSTVSRAPSSFSSVHRTFVSSSCIRQAPAKATHLSSLLAQEIVDETANFEVDQDFLDVKALVEKKYKITESEGAGILTLMAHHDDETIEIKFDCQGDSEVPEGLEDFQARLEASDEDEEVPEQGTGIAFHVHVSKPAKGSLLINCVAADQIYVRNVQYLPEGETLLNHSLYAGPMFSRLGEEHAAAWKGYIEERGINADMSYFILSLANEKESREYIHWLKGLNEFTSRA